MFFKYLIPILILASISLCEGADSYVDPEVQIGGKGRSWSKEGVRLGMPGLANILSYPTDVDGKTDPKYIPQEDVMPSGLQRLVIPLEHKISYAGKDYRHLTVLSNGRIYLGNNDDYRLSIGENDGAYPYVQAVVDGFGPAQNSNSIPVRWRYFTRAADEYTVIEFGPFVFEGYAERFLCQVSFYHDGEIQVQLWNMDRKNDYQHAPNNLSFSTERNLKKPYVFNGRKRIEFNGYNKELYLGGPTEIFSKGQLREGWIAKAFQFRGPIFKIENSYLDVDFGDYEYSGGVLAYDLARENPVVGGIRYINAKTIWLGAEGGNEPVYFWYFDETKMHNNNTLHAGYPYFGFEQYLKHNDEVIGLVDNNCINGESIYPCAYVKSWQEANGIDIDTVSAPAIKIQIAHPPEASSSYTGRKIRIEHIAIYPMQPKAIQFRGPDVNKIEYEGNAGESEDVGFLEVGGVRAPLSLMSGTDVTAKIHTPPGYDITKITVNGQVAYSKDDPNVKLKGYIVNILSPIETTVSFSLTGNVKISVSYKKCSTPLIDDATYVMPSYVKNEIFYDPADKTKVLETYSVLDGFGDVVQTQTVLDKNLYSVSATYRDDAGNALYAPKTYIVKKTAYSFERMYCQQCVNNSAAYFDGQTDISKERVNSYGVPYTQYDYRYGENMALRGVRAGMGEASFSLGKNFAKTWKIPLETSASSEFYSQKQLESAVSSDKSDFDIEYENRLAAINDADLSLDGTPKYSYVLTINQSIDGIFTQSISDVAGNLIATWSNHDGEVLITRNVYNTSTSQLAMSYVEGRIGFTTSYEYDDAGRLVATESPDRGRKEMKYDSQNRMRFTRDARQIAKGGASRNYFNFLVYDNQDRVVQEGEVRGGNASFDRPDDPIPSANMYLFSETIYGKPSVGELCAKGLSNKMNVGLATNIVNAMEGVGANDIGALISYDGEGNVNTIKLASYDRLGHKKKQWIVNLVEANAPAIEMSYDYTASGQVKKSVASEWNYSQGTWNPISKRQIGYGKFDRIENIYELDLTDENSKKSLASYSYNAVGTLEKETYYDKGLTVYSKEIDNDIYGRITQIDYKNSQGKGLYKEELHYLAPALNRLSGITHTWSENTRQELTAEESFGYDDLGRLTTFETDMDKMTYGSYGYDVLGRLTLKAEARRGLEFGYEDGSYRPTTVLEKGAEIPRAQEYDASGNLWLDGNTRTAYRTDASGHMTRVAFYKGGFPDGLTADNAGDGTGVRQILYGYDESGSRVWEHSVNFQEGDYGKITVPGFGSFKKERDATGYTLERLDLAAGGYRIGADGTAMFPLTDAQGNIRGYADYTALRSKYAYYPFGSVVSIDAEESSADNRRWQSKELDSEYGKYYFGARYYDPVLGLWTSPDPAGQFQNPYTYGGDPVNYVDPSGMWSAGIGFVFGWDGEHGWQMGFGSAMDFGFGLPGFNTSYTWNQDGSNSFNLGGDGSIWLGALDLSYGLSFSWNTYSGSVLSAHSGACFGKEGIACAGMESGYALSWDRSGDFMGMTAYIGAYYEVFGGLERVSTGYEEGFLGMEGRGLYAGATVAGLHAEVSERDGDSWGMQERVFYGIGNNVGRARFEDNNDVVSSELWIPSLGRFGHFTFGEKYDVSPEGSGAAQDAYFEDNINDIEKGIVLKRDIETKDGKKLYSDKMVAEIHKQMMANGYSVKIEKAHTFWNRHEGDKYTYYKDGSRGNVEIIKIGGNNSYASYNYGNYWWSHFFIDFMGYHLRK